MRRNRAVSTWLTNNICSVVSVRSQPLTSCRASANCVGGPGDDVGVTVDGRSCCMDNPRALAFVVGEGSCVPCVGECTYIGCTKPR